MILRLSLNDIKLPDMNLKTQRPWREIFSHLSPAWFVPIMGWCGLSLIWLQAPPLGGLNQLLFQSFALFAWGLTLIIYSAYLFRTIRFFDRVVNDLKHPGIQAMFGAFPISLLLIAATCWNWFHVAYSWIVFIWIAGALLELAATVWLVFLWSKIKTSQGLQTFSPLIFIPVAGHVIVPLAGMPLGFELWSMIQFALGLFLWPIGLVLIAWRIKKIGAWPEVMSPTWFILVAPPSMMGIYFFNWQSPIFVYLTFGLIALLSLCWAIFQLPRIVQLPFDMPHWAMSFPLTAFTSLALLINRDANLSWLHFTAIALLITSTIVIIGLTLFTFWGLYLGRLLAHRT
ncbi:MAG: hypothetical protein EBT78_04785 [Betaproteobacteria bacterium]|jgi:tellurite resistance protein|nr:hypothetical protein [Betaproteobacteria bacterium]NBT67057.1 hypothetical protein [Betaproteobacteria bacterium]NBY08134.1 hypothetical protein [Betaproteobacteria bacterium]